MLVNGNVFSVTGYLFECYTNICVLLQGKAICAELPATKTSKSLCDVPTGKLGDSDREQRPMYDERRRAGLHRPRH